MSKCVYFKIVLKLISDIYPHSTMLAHFLQSGQKFDYNATLGLETIEVWSIPRFNACKLYFYF